jgi:Predicted glycosyl hydrolase
MEIHVVQEGDTLESIAEKYGVLKERIILDNGLVEPYKLLIGQALVITHPVQSHVVKEGDTLQSIADMYNITMFQILKNNPFLVGRKYIFPGETLVISYNTVKDIMTTGFTYPFIDRETLIKTLPDLTYISIINYTSTQSGGIRSYQDDSEIIATAKEYGTIPLLFLTTLTPQGISDPETAYEILLNEKFQDANLEAFVNIMKSKGYLGVNIMYNYLNKDSEILYQKFTQKISDRLIQEGLLFFISINYLENKEDDTVSYDPINYGALSENANGLIFLKFKWGTNNGPPEPVSNISNIKLLMEYVTSMAAPDKIIIGIPVIGYDWKLPYVPDQTSASALAINSVMDLAYEVDATIQFDEVSQTPFFYYNQFNFDYPFQHIVWFIDARSIKGICDLIIDEQLNGSAIWNIMIYNPQVWTVINATFNVIKLI